MVFARDRVWFVSLFFHVATVTKTCECFCDRVCLFCPKVFGGVADLSWRFVVEKELTSVVK